MTRARHAFTFVEALIAAILLALVLGIVQGVLAQASRGTARAVETGDALRSVAIAADRIRRDVARMVLQDPQRDLSIPADGRGLSVRVPRPATTDYWSAAHDPVRYRLDPARGGAFRLVREDARGGAVVPGCHLTDLRVKLVPAGTVSPTRHFLEVTLVGTGAGGNRAVYASSMLLPLELMASPRAYLSAEVPL